MFQWTEDAPKQCSEDATALQYGTSRTRCYSLLKKQSPGRDILKLESDH